MLRNSGDGNRLKFLPQFGAFFQFAPDSGIGFVVNPGRNVNIPSPLPNRARRLSRKTLENVFSLPQ